MSPGLRRWIVPLAGWTALLLLVGTGVAGAAPQDFFLHGAGGTANPPTLFLDTTVPTAATEKYKDSPSINFSGGNPWKDVGTWPADPPLTPGTLSALSDLHIFSGLKNSDDQGTNFDLRAEVFKNGALVTSGLTRCITGVTRPAANAQEVLVAFGAFPPAVFNGTSETLSLTLSTRIGTNPDNSKCAPGHHNAVGLRVYFDATDRLARVGATFGAPPPGPLTQARASHTATLMPDGTVLLTGGTGPSGVLSSAERIDPVTLSATALTDSLTTPRTDHTATLLPQTDTLLIAGQDPLGLLFSIERFKLADQTFQALAPSVQVLRAGHTATGLMDGRVLIAGGQSAGALETAEAFNAQTVVIFKPAYDPEQGTFTVLPNGLLTPRWDHAATTLADGRVLLTGGRNETGVLASAEVFDPAAETFTTLTATLTSPRAGHTSTLLPDGRVLLLGGEQASGALATAEVFSPATTSFAVVTPGLMTPRVNHASVLLPTGFVFVSGGQNSNGILASTELYSPTPADTLAPTVQQVSPASGAIGVDRTELLAVRFSEPVDVRTLTATSVTLTGGGPVAATISPGEQGLMLFVIPSAPLAAGTIYTLSLTPDIKDTSGHPLAAFTSQFTTVAAPTITSFDPASGTPGTDVTITGTNFDPVASKNQVTFNGALAIVTAASATSLTTSVPAGATTGPITVTTRGGAATSATNFTVITGPTITSFTPTSGPTGTSVMISGQNFDGTTAANNQVKFNGKSAIITSASVTTITTTVPQGATTGPITVTTPQGTATTAQNFTVTLAQNFTLSATPALATVLQGGQGNYVLSVTAVGSFTGLVTLGVTGLPTGATASFSSPTLTTGQTTYLTVKANVTVPVGAVALTLTGSTQLETGPSTQTIPLSLNVLAGAGQTHLTGQFLSTVGDTPIPNVQVSLGTIQATTDAAGTFLLQNVPSGLQKLMINGSSPNGAFMYSTDLTVVAGQTNVTPPFYVAPDPPLDRFTPITNTAVDQTVTDPRYPGVSFTIPAGVTIVGWDNVPKTKMAFERLDLDRLGIPPPPIAVNSVYQPYFATEAGVSSMGGLLNPAGSIVRVSLPNDLGLNPGEKAEIWVYDATPVNLTEPSGWKLAGLGTVIADGTTIVGDPGVGITRFCKRCGTATCGCDPAAIVNGKCPPNPSPGGKKVGDPLDAYTGIFTADKTDLVLPGRLPVTIARTYSPFDAYDFSGQGFGSFVLSLGRGWVLSLDVTLHAVNTSGSLYRVVLPPNSRLDLARQANGTWVNGTHPLLQGAVLSTLPGSGHQLRFKDGTVWTFQALHTFPDGSVLEFLVAQSDRNGNTITIERGASGVLSRVVDASNRALTVSSLNGRIVQIQDPAGRVVSYSYNGSGRLDTVTDPDQGTTRYTYDSAGRITSITDPRGIPFLQNFYGPSGRVLRQVQADGGEWLFRYQVAGASVTGPGCPGVTCPTEDTWENFQLSYSVTGGTVVETTARDPRGQPTVSRFNNRGFETEVRTPLGQKTTLERDTTNQVTRGTDPLGRTTTYTYDAAGNVLTITDPDNKTTTFTYEPTFNRVTQIKDALNQITEFTYDANGNLLTTKDPLNHVTTITYNGFGQPTSVQGPIPSEPPTTFGYDADGNLITTTDPLGNATQRAYDAVSRLTQVTDPRGRSTQFQYDARNRVQTIADAAQGLTRLLYDATGNLTQVEDAKGQATAYTYDQMDRLATRTDALNRQEAYQYDPAGNLTQFTDRKNQPSTFTYDALNRRTHAGYADGSSTAFTYDSVGRLSVAEDSSSGKIEFTYDTLDRLINELTPQGVVNYGYDALGRRTTMTANGQQPVTYGYDAASRLTQVAQGSQIVGLGYDNANRRTSLTYPNGVTTTYGYDNASRLTSIVHQGPSALIESLSYTYDAAGNRISLTRANGTATLLPAAVQAAYDAANEQIQFNSATPNLAYDANGNLQTQTDVTGTTTYTWDGRNRLVALSGPSLNAAFQYDALGRRVSKTIDGMTTQYLYDGKDIVQEIGGGAVRANYLRSLKIDELFVRQASGNEFYHADALGSMLALSNAVGTTTVSYSYETFGRTTLTGSSLNPFQYTGRENDGADLYYNRTRYYSPRLARFVAQDSALAPSTPLGLGLCPETNGIIWALREKLFVPEALSGQFLNAYAYVQNNPVRFSDPSGLDKDIPCLNERRRCLNDALKFAQTDLQRTCVNVTLGAYCPRVTQEGALNQCIQRSLYNYNSDPNCPGYLPPSCQDVQNCSYQQDPLPGRPPGRRPHL